MIARSRQPAWITACQIIITLIAIVLWCWVVIWATNSFLPTVQLADDVELGIADGGDQPEQESWGS